MRKKKLECFSLFFSIFSLLFVIFSATPTQVSASSELTGDFVIFDQPDLLTEQDETRIVEAIESLNNSTGVDAKVIVINNIGSYANLDLYFADLIEQVPALQSPNGGMKTNLLVLIMSYEDRNRGVFYAVTGTLKNAFQDDPELSLIQADYLVPEFQAGDFAQGFIGTINEAERVIDNYLHPVVNTDPVVEDNPVASQPAKSGPSAWIFLLILFFIFLVLLFVYIGYVLVRRYQRIVAEREAAEEARQTMHGEAKANCMEALAIFVTFSDQDFEKELEAKVKKYIALDKSKKKELEGHLGTYRMNHAEFISIIASTEERNGNVSDDTLPIESYTNMSTAYTHAKNKANNIKTSVDRIDEICDDIDEHIACIPRKIEICEEMEATARRNLEYATKQNLKLPESVNKIDSLCVAFQKQKTAKRTVENLEALQKTEKAFQAIADDISTVIEQDKQLSSSIPKLEADIKSVKETLIDIKPIFADLKKHHAESSWSSVSGNGSTAERAIKDAEHLLEQAKQQFSEKLYEVALDSISDAESDLENAKSLLSAISSRRDSLVSYKKQAPVEFRLAEIDIQKAEEYLKTHMDDLNYEQYRSAIDDAINDLRLAKEEFAKPLPDYSKVIELALEANHDADDVLEDCVNEVEQLQRLRHQVSETKQKAKNDIDEAERYIQNHRSDVRSSASEILSRAKQALSKTSNFDNPARELDEARKACELALQALDKAKRDVRDAAEEREEEERRERRRREEMNRTSYHNTIISSSHRSSSSFSSPSFGGSSGSFGSSSPSIGGSSGKW